MSRTMTQILTAAVLAGAGLLAAGLSMPVNASPYKDRAVPMEQASKCPPRWEQGNGNFGTSVAMCYPQYANSPEIYRNRSKNCRSGYGNYSEMWCVQGYDEHPQLSNPHVFTKTNKDDRCPAGFYTYFDKCTTELARPSKARPKGNGNCAAGEIAEWGIWCTSDYQHLTMDDIKSAAIRDYNNIAGNTGREPRQSPDNDYSEVYTALFGDSRPAGKVWSKEELGMLKLHDPAQYAEIMAAQGGQAPSLLEGDKAGSATGNEGAKTECNDVKLRGKLGQLARKAMGC